jgi:hypothetical protein
LLLLLPVLVPVPLLQLLETEIATQRQRLTWLPTSVKKL